MYTSATFLLAIVASVQAANVVHQRVVYTAPGVKGVVGNGFGCANFSPTGKSSQLGCVKHVFTDGFTVGITDHASKNVTLCSISGTSGACGPNGANIKVDLTGGTGTAPCPSGPEGTKSLTPAQLSNKPIRKRSVDFEAEARDFIAEERSADEDYEEEDLE